MSVTSRTTPGDQETEKYQGGADILGGCLSSPPLPEKKIWRCAFSLSSPPCTQAFCAGHTQSGDAPLFFLQSLFPCSHNHFSGGRYTLVPRFGCCGSGGGGGGGGGITSHITGQLSLHQLQQQRAVVASQVAWTGMTQVRSYKYMIARW